MDLYRLNILDHYKNPRNYGTLTGNTISSHQENPSCGDSISMDVITEDDKIKDIKFKGEGCALAVASASMLTEFVKGKKIADVQGIEFKDMLKLLNIEVNKSREKCVMLSLEVLKELIKK